MFHSYIHRVFLPCFLFNSLVIKNDNNIFFLICVFWYEQPFNRSERITINFLLEASLQSIDIPYSCVTLFYVIMGKVVFNVNPPPQKKIAQLNKQINKLLVKILFGSLLFTFDQKSLIDTLQCIEKSPKYWINW